MTVSDNVVALASAIGADMARTTRDGAATAARLARLEQDLRTALGRQSAVTSTLMTAIGAARTAAAATAAPSAVIVPFVRTARGRHGLGRETGKAVTGWAHVCQSIRDILTTRIGSRVMVRDYGSDLPRLIDAPMTAPNILALYVAVAEALTKWEPRFALTRVAFAGDIAAGRVDLMLTGLYLPRGHLGDRTPASGGERTFAFAGLGVRIAA